MAKFTGLLGVTITHTEGQLELFNVEETKLETLISAINNAGENTFVLIDDFAGVRTRIMKRHIIRIDDMRIYA